MTCVCVCVCESHIVAKMLGVCAWVLFEVVARARGRCRPSRLWMCGQGYIRNRTAARKHIYIRILYAQWIMRVCASDILLLCDCADAAAAVAGYGPFMLCFFLCVFFFDLRRKQQKRVPYVDTVRAFCTLIGFSLLNGFHNWLTIITIWITDFETRKCYVKFLFMD